MKNSVASFLVIGALVVAFAASACGKKDNSSSAPSSTPTPGAPSEPPTVSEDAPLALQLFTTYETTNYSVLHTFQETASTRCESTPANPVVICTIKVPEGRLYYSRLTFQFSWLATSCKLLRFFPYQYRSSTADGHLPPWSTSPLECTKNLQDCYGGAAPSVVPDFPNFTHFIYFPDETDPTGPLSTEVALPSGYTRRYVSNRAVCSDLSATNVANTYTSADLGGLGDEYVANSFVPYVFTCQDDWQDTAVYQITVIVTDENSESGDPGVNHRRTWKELP